MMKEELELIPPDTSFNPLIDGLAFLISSLLLGLIPLLPLWSVSLSLHLGYKSLVSLSCCLFVASLSVCGILKVTAISNSSESFCRAISL